MYFWTTSISAILAGRQRNEHARQEQVRLERQQIRVFCEDVVLAAMQRIGGEFERHGRHVQILRNHNILAMTVFQRGKVEFAFSAATSRRHPSRKHPGRHHDRAGYAHSVDRVYSLSEARSLRAEQVCREIVARYRKERPA